MAASGTEKGMALWEVASEKLGYPSSHESRRHEPCPVQVSKDDVILS